LVCISLFLMGNTGLVLVGVVVSNGLDESVSLFGKLGKGLEEGEEVAAAAAAARQNAAGAIVAITAVHRPAHPRS